MISIPSVKEEQYQFVVQFLLDICCIPHVDKASINETYFEEVPIKAPAASAKPTASASTTTTEEKKDEEKKPEEEAPKTEKVKKERSNLCMLKISEINYGNSKGVLDALIQKEANQENEDGIYKITIGRRNEIENNIYSTRIKMEDELKSYISEEEKIALPPLMDETETWLYSGDDAVYDKKALETKCAKFIDICNKIYGRYNNWRNLDQAINFMDDYNASSMTRVNQISESSLKDFIDQQQLVNLITASNASVNELKTALVKSPRFMEPSISADKIKAEYEVLNNVGKFFLLILIFCLF